jgi:valyl-tRNA synthetase
VTDELAKVYDPKQVEDRWYGYWTESGFFQAPVVEGKQPYTIVIPPPNVTGALHMGHALNNTIIDILIRYRRMTGRPTLYLPGTDHAGLATQIRVEDELRAQGKSKQQLGREKFIDQVWAWKEKYAATINGQLKRLGVSVDWTREAFTMDENLSSAVRSFFVQLYKKGLIYQGTRIVSWCPNDQTALSDIEVEHEERQGQMWYFRYPLEDGSGEVVVATTRPETMLGDTAVAVNPADERFQALVGKQCIQCATGRRIPIIADELVDPAFGTGCVKVTPFHDPNDYEMGERHGLVFIQVIGLDGRMTEAAGKYADLDRYECRKQLVRDMEEQGYLVRVEDHTHSVGECQRCGSAVEPLISKQWYVRMQPLAESAAAAVRTGEIEIVPERFTKVYLHWMENIQDWCISRQIWWGHRIPVWHCSACGGQTCEMEDPPACAQCGSTAIEQDPDALDTWFSSALWPFSTLGWPDTEARDYRYFYPNDVLVTGYDILFFWVARMIFSGLELTGRTPFSHVVLHGLIRDSLGRKMSKSLGNGIDPLEVIDQFGSDTLRFTLVTGNSPGNDMRFNWERVESSRNFANKLWNASRFALMNLADYKPGLMRPEYDLADYWIRTRFVRTVEAVTRLIEEFQLGEAARVLHDFIWGELCDWYIELIKPRLYRSERPESRHGAQETLALVLEGTLRLLHPYMPFITEEIWQKLPVRAPEVPIARYIARTVGRDAMPPSITIRTWPKVNPTWLAPQAESQMALIVDAIRAIRNIRAEMNVPPGKKADAVIMAGSPETLRTLQAGSGFLEDLGRVQRLEIKMAEPAKPEHAATAVIAGAEIYVPLKGLIDIEKEIDRLAREASGVEAELGKLRAKLGNENFVAKAKPEVVEKVRAEEREYAGKLEAIQSRLQTLRSL